MWRAQFLIFLEQAAEVAAVAISLTGKPRETAHKAIYGTALDRLLQGIQWSISTACCSGLLMVT
jgi:hypothetical protein